MDHYLKTQPAGYEQLELLEESKEELFLNED